MISNLYRQTAGDLVFDNSGLFYLLTWFNFDPSTVQPLKFGNRWVISSHTLLGMWLLIYGGLKLNHVSKRPQELAKPAQRLGKD